MTEYTVSSNERIVAVLHALVTRWPHGQASGVRELAEMLGVSRSTVSRVLLALTEHEFAATTSAGTYQAGPRLHVLAAGLHARHPLLSRSGEVVEDLAEKADATVIMAVHDAPRPQVVVVACRRHPGPISYSLEPGTVLPLHAGATGRAILGRVGMDALGSEPLEAKTPDTVTGRAELRRILARDRDAGYTISVGQQFRMAAGVAASFQCSGLTGSVSITRPRHLVRDEDLTRFGPMARKAARAIERSCTEVIPASRDRHLNKYPTGGTALARMSRLLGALTAEPSGLDTDLSFARRIGANVATVNRLVSTARISGLAIADHGTLLPGPRLLHWAACLGPDLNVSSAIHHVLRDLAAHTGETIGLTEYDAVTQQARMTAVLNGARYGLVPGVTTPLYAGASGKSILAHCPPSTLDNLTLRPLTEHTPTSRDVVAADLQVIRERGYARVAGERIPDALGISAPYFADGCIAGSITATVPSFRASEIDLDALTEAVKSAADRITRLLSVI